MSKTYDVAMRFRIAGIIASVIALLLVIIRPFEPVFTVGLIYFLLILSAILIITGQLIVIKFVPEEEFRDQLQRKEAVYDVITTGVVIVIFGGIYVIPFILKHLL